MEMIEATGICRYCGQTKLVEVPDYFTEKEIEEEASTECYCNGAKDHKKAKELEAMIEQQKESARGTTFQLFHEEFPEIEKMFNSAINPLADHKFKKVTVSTDDGMTASIKWKDGIEVERVDKNINRIKTRINENVYK